MFSLNPCNSNFINSLELVLKVIAGLAATYAFYIGFKRYKKDQSWKRSEWVAKEIKDFTSDFMVRNAMYMLDWGTRDIELSPTNPNASARFVRVNREMLNNALEIHDVRQEPAPGETRFNTNEIAIRDTFDHFLSSFGKFNQFIEAGLITPAELRPYLIYWITTIANDLNSTTRVALHDYIERYQFTDIQNFFLKFNIDIVTDSTHRAAKRDTLPEQGCG